jgi:excisionase family DNA binding protein
VNQLLLKPEEAAEVIRVGRSKMYELLASGVIKSVKIGALRRIPANALEEYVAALAESAQ